MDQNIDSLFLDVCDLDGCISRLPEKLHQLYWKLKNLRLDWNLTNEKLVEIRNHFLSALNPNTVDIKGATVDYGNVDVRKYYVLHFMSAYIQVLFSHLNTAYDVKDEYRNWLRRKSTTSGVKIVSIGGGAGTEIFALHLHLRVLRGKGEMVPDIDSSTILEKCTAWEEQFKEVNFSPHLVRVDYLEFDFMTKNILDEDVAKTLKEADVVTLVKVISPLRKSATDHQKIIQSKVENVFRLMKPDALVLFMDTNFRSKFSRPVEHAAHQCKLKHIFEVHGEFSLESMSFLGVKVRQNPSVHQVMWIKNSK